MNKYLEQHEGEWMMAEFSFWSELTFQTYVTERQMLHALLNK